MTKTKFYVGAIEWLKYNLKYHLVNSAAQVGVATPIMVAYETGVTGIPDEQSLYARLLGASLTFGGIGYLDARFRDFARKKLHVEDTTNEFIQGTVDIGSRIVFNLARFPSVYFAVGIRDLDTLIALTTFGVGYSFVSGYFSGYAMDLSRELTGIQESKRIPSYIRNHSPPIKKAIFAGLIASSILLTMGIYKITNNPSKAIEQHVESVTTPAIDLESVLENEK